MILLKGHLQVCNADKGLFKVHDREALVKQNIRESIQRARALLK